MCYEENYHSNNCFNYHTELNVFPNNKLNTHFYSTNGVLFFEKENSFFLLKGQVSAIKT